MAERTEPAEEPVVLILEDEPLISMMVRELFESEGIACVAASSLADAERLAHGRAFSAAILDVNVRGVMVFPIARKLTDTGTPCIFLTGYDREQIPAEFATARFIQKPCSAPELIRAVHACIGSSRK